MIGVECGRRRSRALLARSSADGGLTGTRLEIRAGGNQIGAVGATCGACRRPSSAASRAASKSPLVVEGASPRERVALVDRLDGGWPTRTFTSSSNASQTQRAPAGAGFAYGPMVARPNWVYGEMPGCRSARTADHPARRAHALTPRRRRRRAEGASIGSRQGDHIAYLVGGSVRDLLLGRRPKDFDIGTSAHPYQVKKLFRNCWIIGRRFRLAHVKFGAKVIEVATFRRQVQPGEEVVQDGARRGARREAPTSTTRATPTGGTRTSSTATTPSALRKRMRSAGTSPSTRSSTTSPRSRSSTTLTASPTCGPASSGRLAIRKSGSSKIRCACCGRWRSAGAARLSRSIRRSRGRHPPPPPRARAQLAGAKFSEYTLQDPARWRTPRRRSGRLPDRPARADCAGALSRRRGRAIGCGTRSPPWIRIDAVSEGTPDAFTNTVLLGSFLVPLGFSAQPARVPPRPSRR